MKLVSLIRPIRSLGIANNGLYNVRNHGTPRFMSSLSQQFEEAKSKLNTLQEDPGNDVKLKLYALFKQSTEGTVQTKRPGMTDFVGRAKWDAWKAIGDISQDQAQKAYIDLIHTLVKEEAPAKEETDSSSAKYQNLIYEVNNGLCKITLNRPSQKNALSFELYHEWVNALEEAAKDPKVIVAAVTGAGDYFCSGNDLKNFLRVDMNKLELFAKEAHDVLDSGTKDKLKPLQERELSENYLSRLSDPSWFVSAFINFPKPLIAVVNGPAIGVSVTTLALYDAVYATQSATFHTPFSSLGQSPEGCSSYTFPMLMGFGKSSELLLFNKKITAQEAFERNLVTQVFPDDSFQKEVWSLVEKYPTFASLSMIHSKTLTRALHKENLHKINKLECERLIERWTSEDCKKAIMGFFSKK